MATTFPESIQTFPTLMDITQEDAQLVSQYQEAMRNGDIETASQILRSISNYQHKFINADILNTMQDTLMAIEQFYADKYNPSYIVSDTMPSGQSAGDYWFEIIEEIEPENEGE